ncbi:MAG: SpoIIE family protein phosphatase [bacterium]|nr:SpoIIE family protein phosphatase [bacterium]
MLDQYAVELLGSRVTSYHLDRVIDSKTIKISASRRHGDDSDAGIVMPITWVIILLILVVRFIRKIRKDQLEFKRALWLGIAAGLLIFILVAVNAWKGGWIAVLVGGGFSALFVFLGVMLVHPAAESQCRSVWPKKLAVIDLLFQGKFLIRETGEAILRSFFLVGLTLSAFGILVFAVPALDIAYVSVGNEMLNMFQSPVVGVTIIIKNILFALFAGLTFLCFWPGFLREKLKNTMLLLFLLAFSFGLAGLQFIFFNPKYLGFVLFFPIVLGWAYIVYKYDLLTVLFSTLGIMMLLDMMFVLVIPGSLYSIPGTVTIGFTAIFFLLGIYLIFHPRSAEDYADYVPEYVSRLAEQERLLKELEIARNVQMRFLPQEVPEFPNLEIVSLCQPAMEVGGDYYDFVRMDDNCMSVLIGDVSGKGVSAAFYMTMVKGIIKTLSKKTRQPAVLLAEANEIFCENAPRDVFITVIYGIFDQSAQTLTLASAGHNPLIAWKKKTNTIQLFNPRGIALGLEQGKRYREIIEETVIPVEEGDIFVFYTDGVSESMNMKSEIFGEGRLKEIIESSSHLSPRLIQKNIVEAVSRFSGQAPQHDDFTMVVVKVKPRGTGGLL